MAFSVAVDLSCLIERPLTGVGYYARNLFRASVEQVAGIRLRAFVSSAQERPDDLAEILRGAEKLAAFRFPTRWKDALWTRYEWPPVEWFTGKSDIVHGGFHLLPPSRAAKRVVTIHDLSGMRRAAIHHDAAQAAQRRLLAHAIPRADGIFAVSQSCRADVIELLGANPDKVFVVPGGVMLDEFDGALDEVLLDSVRRRHEIDGDYLIHLGTLEPRKNLERLVEVYARLADRHADLPQLVLAGGKGWMYEPLFEAIERHGLAKRVICTGYLGRRDAVALLRGALALVYPSLYEGFGLPVLEAMAARVPVLTSNVSALPEVIGSTGILVDDPENEEELGAALTRLVFERGDEDERVEAAWLRAQKMTWGHSARALKRSYQAVLDGTGYSPANL
jgi:glycosyltransferase involved in cell wall biosynthesis